MDGHREIRSHRPAPKPTRSPVNSSPNPELVCVPPRPARISTMPEHQVEERAAQRPRLFCNYDSTVSVSGRGLARRELRTRWCAARSRIARILAVDALPHDGLHLVGLFRVGLPVGPLSQGLEVLVVPTAIAVLFMPGSRHTRGASSERAGSRTRAISSMSLSSSFYAHALRGGRPATAAPDPVGWIRIRPNCRSNASLR